jgi:hypothetical protein
MADRFSTEKTEIGQEIIITRCVYCGFPEDPEWRRTLGYPKNHPHSKDCLCDGQWIVEEKLDKFCQ